MPLRPLASRALLVLVRRAGRLTTRDELRQALWVDSILDWNQALNQCIRQIRSILGDCADRPRFLETVHGRGYRFIALVTPAPGVTSGIGATSAAGAPHATPPAAAARRGSYGFFIAGMGATLAIVAVLLSICARI